MPRTSNLLLKNGQDDVQRSAWRLFVSPRAGNATAANTWLSLLAGVATWRYRVLWASVAASASTGVNLNEGNGSGADGSAANDFASGQAGASLSFVFNPVGNGFLLAAGHEIGIVTVAAVTVWVTIYGFVEGTSSQA